MKVIPRKSVDSKAKAKAKAKGRAIIMQLNKERRHYINFLSSVAKSLDTIAQSMRAQAAQSAAATRVALSIAQRLEQRLADDDKRAKAYDRRHGRKRPRQAVAR